MRKYFARYRRVIRVRHTWLTHNEVTIGRNYASTRKHIRPEWQTARQLNRPERPTANVNCQTSGVIELDELTRVRRNDTFVLYNLVDRNLAKRGPGIKHKSQAQPNARVSIDVLHVIPRSAA